jgi:hypothetical protein
MPEAPDPATVARAQQKGKLNPDQAFPLTPPPLQSKEPDGDRDPDH